MAEVGERSRRPTTRKGEEEEQVLCLRYILGAARPGCLRPLSDSFLRP